MSTTPAPDREAAPLRGTSRAVRAAALGTASLGLAVGAHLLGGGTLPGAGLLALTAALLGLVAVTATARRVRARLLLPLLAVEQVLLHVLLEAGSGTGPSCVAVGAAHAGHHAGNTLLCTPGAADTAMAMPSWPMLVAHLLATAATTWVLLRGEDALWSLTDRVVRAASPTLRPWPVSPAPALLTAPARRPLSRPSRTAAPRGPPPVLAVR